jgi:predicted transcriptional regulator
MRPTIQKTLAGTELLWKFETLRPHEERVISYHIKPAMDIVGEIRLPKANVRYMDHRKEFRKSISKHLIVEI